MLTLQGPLVTVGSTEVGNLCHFPVLVDNMSCLALVDTGYMATLLRPDVVQVGISLGQTGVKFQTVTRETALMKGRGTFLFRLGSLTVTFQAWVAEVRDTCILGLDFLRFTGCTLNLNCGVLMLPGGECIELTSPVQQVSWIVPTYSLTACAMINRPMTNDHRAPHPCQLTRDLKD